MRKLTFEKTHQTSQSRSVAETLKRRNFRHQSETISTVDQIRNILDSFKLVYGTEFFQDLQSIFHVQMNWMH